MVGSSKLRACGSATGSTTSSIPPTATDSYYAVGYALCESPLGPCRDAAENPILASDMSRFPLVIGPGHLTVFSDDAGESWVVYHVWDCTASGRRLDRRVV